MNTFYADFCAGKGRGGWRRVGKILGISGAYARELANGKKTLTEEIARTWLVETEKIIPIVEVQVCPSCLERGITEAHVAGDCKGRPIASVVTLAPDEAVVKRNGSAPKRERKKYHRPCFDESQPEKALVKLAQLTAHFQTLLEEAKERESWEAR